MKKLILFTISIALLVGLSSCDVKLVEEVYPKYTVYRTTYIPDSLKEKQREFIIEAIRAANQHLTAGDYEDVEDVVDEVNDMADELFRVKGIGLKKIFNSSYNYIYILPDHLTDREQDILDSLLNI